MSEAIQFTGRVIRQTEMAILFYPDGWYPVDESQAIWLPKYLVGIIHDAGDRVLIDMPDWLAEKKGL